MLRFVPPAGAPLEFSEIIRASREAASNHREGKSLQALAAALNVRYAFGAASGRSALAVILRSLARLKPERRTVALPAYTCFTVPAAVVRAGLRIYPVEIDPETLDFNFSDLDRLPADDLLCIVSSNLFGLASNGKCIRTAARARGAFFIDDAAQAMGATRNGSAAGLMGDVGFYSFGRGKALPAMEGALIVTNSNDIAEALREEAAKLPESSILHSGKLLFQMFAYSAFLRPSLYWLPQSLPFVKLGVTEFDPEFREFRLPGLVRELVARTEGKLKLFNGIRARNASVLAEAARENSNFKTPQPSEDSSPNYIRFPIIARDERIRSKALGQFRAAGIGATPYYPSALCDIEGMGAHMAVENFHRPKAEDLASRLFTVPTHPYVQARDLETMTRILRQP